MLDQQQVQTCSSGMSVAASEHLRVNNSVQQQKQQHFIPPPPSNTKLFSARSIALLLAEFRNSIPKRRSEIILKMLLLPRLDCWKEPRTLWSMLIMMDRFFHYKGFFLVSSTCDCIYCAWSILVDHSPHL